MDVIFVLAVAILIEKSGSQTLSHLPTCYTDGDILELKCETPDFTKAINFLLDGSSEGGCSVGCAPNIVQSGTVTTKTLSPFIRSTHSGNWTCSYGLSVSDEVIIAENPCDVTTEGSTKGVEVETCNEIAIYFTWFAIHTFIQVLVLIGMSLKIRHEIKKKTFKKGDLSNYLIIQIGLDFFTTAAIIMWGVLYWLANCFYFSSDPNCSVGYIALGWLVYAVIWKFLTPLVIYLSYKDKTVHVSNDKTERASNAMPILAPPNVQKDKTERASNAMPILAPPNVQKADKSVMLLVEKIDRELPTKIIWTNTNGTVPKDTPKYSYGVLPKISLKINSVLKEDTGIYQCVRTLQNGKKDNINVVLRVTDICGITLKVNPLFWENKIFEQPVTQLTEMVKSITLASNLKNKTTKNKIESVEWKYRSEKVDVNTILTEIDYSILSEAKEGEYTCSVKLSNETQLYVFHIVFLDQVPSKLKTSNGVCVIGVPSMLHSTGIQKLKEDELNDQQNKQI